MRIIPAFGVVLVGAAACPVMARAHGAIPIPAPKMPLAVVAGAVNSTGAMPAAEPVDALQTPVTLNFRDRPLLSVAKMLEQSAPVHFRYGAPPDLAISANLSEVPMLSALSQVLRGTGWTFKRSGADVFLYPARQTSNVLTDGPGSWSWYNGEVPPSDWLAVPNKTLAVRLREGTFNNGTEPRALAEGEAAISGPPEPIVWPTGLLRPSIAPPQPASQPPITLTYHDISVLDLADSIARKGGVRILVGSDVTARIKTISLFVKTPEMAIRTIALDSGLVWLQIDDNTFEIGNRNADFPLKDAIEMPRPTHDRSEEVATQPWYSVYPPSPRVARPGLQVVRERLLFDGDPHVPSMGSVVGGDHFSYKNLRFLRCRINLKFVPAGTRLMLETATSATFYVNGAPLLRNFSGMRSVDLTGALHSGDNMLALAFAPEVRNVSIFSRETHPVFSYEWLFQPEPRVPAG